jgi:O-methyltransferase domain
MTERSLNGDSARLAQLLAGFMPVQLAYVMTRLRLADLLERGPATVEQLAAATDVRPDLLLRLVRGLVGIGLLQLAPGERISLTGMGALLGSRTPGSMRDVALHRGGEAFAAWGELEYAVRTGRPAFEAAHGNPFFAYLRSDPKAGAVFDGTMTRLSEGVVAEVAERYDFSTASRVLDVGGGRGHLLAAVLAAHPHLVGDVFDVPELAADVRRNGHGDRFDTIGGDFFASLPAGYDVHLLKWILHDWDDDACRAVLASCRAALPAGGRLLVIEQPLPEAMPDGGALHPAVAMDLVMLVNFVDARERHLREYEELLGSTGFRVEEVVPLASGFSILDCRPLDRAA